MVRDIQPVQERDIALVQDTIHVVYQETVRTVVYDTVRTVISDTQRTVVYDTVRAILADARRSIGEVEEVEETVASDKPFDQVAAKTARVEIQQGQMTLATLSLVTGNVPEFSTVAATELDSLQLDLLSNLFDVRVQAIRRFRWGPYLAPEGHPEAGCIFLKAWRETPQGLAPALVRIDSAGTANKL